MITPWGNVQSLQLGEVVQAGVHTKLFMVESRSACRCRSGSFGRWTLPSALVHDLHGQNKRTHLRVDIV